MGIAALNLCGPRPSYAVQLLPMQRLLGIQLTELIGKASFQYVAADFHGRGHAAVVHGPGFTHQYKVAKAFMGLQLVIKLLQGLRKVSRHLLASLLTGSRRQFDQRQGLIEVTAHQAHLLDPEVLGNLTLNRRWGDVLALAGLEDVLHPPGDFQVTTRVDLALVAGMQPTIARSE